MSCVNCVGKNICCLESGKKSKNDNIHSYKGVPNKLSNRLKHAKRVFFDSLLDDASPSKRFWTYCKSVKILLPSQTQLLIMVFFATPSANIAQIFCQFFSECFNDSDAPDTPPLVYNYFSSISHCSSSSEDIHSFIRKLNNTSAVVVDGITSLMLKELRIMLAQSCLIFSILLSTGGIPDAWKLSRVVPVFKSGDPHTVSNYRPISLQPICCKLLEKVIHGSGLQHLNPTISSLTDNLVSCPSHLPPMLSPLPSMNGMVTRKDAKVLPWLSLICRKLLTVCRIVP